MLTERHKEKVIDMLWRAVVIRQLLIEQMHLKRCKGRNVIGGEKVRDGEIGVVRGHEKQREHCPPTA